MEDAPCVLRASEQRTPSFPSLLFLPSSFPPSLPPRLSARTPESRMKTQNIRTLSLILSIVCYLLIGAAVFDALESDSESARKRALEQRLRELKRKYGFTEEDYGDVERVVLQSEPHRAGRQWNLEDDTLTPAASEPFRLL
ncbi:Potassium channel subfamily K member 15 [Liparis tanakae]|uniref:Potassium channel subfamily K member 15 n=1 Tax=Liparis tanakae TaxID=230148 RepID=A0A4Z2EKY9_9TELE|nr:Potassium channel subfamily K member 15 [Liparis tanakae]